VAVVVIVTTAGEVTASGRAPHREDRVPDTSTTPTYFLYFSVVLITSSLLVQV